MDIALLITACLIAQPTECQTHRLAVYEPMAVQACTLMAQPILAQWAGNNPDKRIVRWGCVREMAL